MIARYAHGDGCQVLEDGAVRGPFSPSPITHDPSPCRWLRLIGAGVALLVVLAGCASSPEAARVRDEPGADPGNHGNPVVLLAPPERADRVYYEIPFVEQGASEDTSQS